MIRCLPPSPWFCTRGGRGSGGRRMRRLVFAMPLLAMLAPGARAADDLRFFRIGTAATSGTYFQIGGVLASAISKPPGTRECEPG